MRSKLRQHSVRHLPHHLQGLKFMREMQQYVASATLIDPCNSFQNATRLVPNATEPTFCCALGHHKPGFSTCFDRRKDDQRLPCVWEIRCHCYSWMDDHAFQD